MLPDEPVTLSRFAVATAWEWEKVGPAHPIIGPVGLWIEADIEAEINDLTRQALAEYGFFNLRTGRVAPAFRDLALSIATAPQECYRWSADQRGQGHAVLAVPSGRDVLRVTVADDLITLEQVRVRHLPEAVVGTLPDHPAAGLREFVVPQHEYASRGNRGGGDSYSLDTTSDYTATPTDPGEQLRTLMASTRVASHQLYAAARTGGARRSSVPLTAVDTTDHGRILTYLRPGHHGGMDIACGPGDDQYLTATLDNTLTGLQQ